MRKGPAPKADRNADIIRLYRDEGQTITAIAAAHGVTRTRVRQILRRAGLATRDDGGT